MERLQQFIFVGLAKYFENKKNLENVSHETDDFLILKLVFVFYAL